MAVRAASYLKPGSSDGVVQYRESDLRLLFGGASSRTGGIPWPELTVNHDSRVAAAHATTRSTHARTLVATPLQAVLAELQNPHLVPVACRGSLVMILIQVSVDSTKAENTKTPPWRAVLMETIHGFLSFGYPSVESAVSECLEKFVQSWQHIDGAHMLQSYSVDRTNRLVAVLQDLTEHCGGGELRTSIQRCLLTLLQNLDDIDIQLLESDDKKSEITPSHRGRCKHCEGNESPRKRRKVATLQQLHDETDGLDDQDNGGVRDTPTATSVGLFKDTSDPVRYQLHVCGYCGVHSALSRVVVSHASEITRLSPALVYLRSRLYQKLLSSFSTLPRASSHASLQYPFVSSRQDSVMIRSAVKLACQHPTSPSIRLSVVLLVDSLASRGYHLMIRTLWDIFKRQSTVPDERALRVYAELVVECSQFDDSTRCWEALRPLTAELIGLCTDAKTTGDIRTRVVLRCFAVILCRRKRTMLSSAPSSNAVVQREFREVVARLALSFGEEHWWVYKAMNVKERDETVYALQAVGIIGFVEENISGLFSDDGLLENDDRCFTLWPFPETRGIRIAARRAGPNVGRAGIFSALHQTQIVHEMESGGRSVMGNLDHELGGTPIMEYLNDDVLRVIFSFFSHKRLVRATGVCKQWNVLANEDNVWRQAYESRYRILQEDSMIAKSVSTRTCSLLGSWKQLFVNKYEAERALRFRRNASGWKHITCNRLGCLMVLRSRSQLKRHSVVHKKRKGRKATSLSCKKQKQKHRCTDTSSATASYGS